MNYGETLCQSMERIAEGVLKGISYDKTVTCTIVDNSKKNQGEYIVTDGSVQFTAYCENTTYLKDTIVYVVIPEGNYDNTKIIVSKKTNEDATKPFIYSAPLANFLDVSGNMYTGKQTEGLTANYSEEIVLMNNQNLIGYKDFTHFGIKADFKSWLSEIECITGDYGLKIVLTFLPEGISGQDMSESKYDLTLYLKTEDMVGNPYNFNSFYTQEKLFNISDLGSIVGIKVSFFQDGNFKNKNNQLIPHTEDNFPDSILNSNLFVQDIYLYTGYELSSYDNDFVQLYSFDSRTYINNDATTARKNIKLKWVHIDKDGNRLDMEDNTIQDFEIRWYQYKLGEPSADEYSGAYWKKIEQLNKKSFNCNLNIDIYKAATEQVKAVVIYNNKFYTSNILSFTNENEVVNNATIDALKALSLVCKDVKDDNIRYESAGNYFIYNENNSLIDNVQYSIQRIIECHLNLQSSGETDGMANISDDDEITWILPNKNTMITSSIIPSGQENNDQIIITYKGSDQINQSKNIVGPFGIPHIGYKIKSYYSPTFSNNTIQCIVKKNGITYTTAKELSFGQAGTTGTDFTFVLDISEDKLAFTKGKIETFTITARLYDVQNNEQDISEKEINWKWFKAPVSQNINIVGDGNTAKLISMTSLSMDEIYILQATLSNWGDYELTAYLPIPIRSSESYLNITGATQVIYLTDGQPKYYNNEYKIYDNTISLVEGNVIWETLCSEKQPSSSASDSDKKKYENIIKYLPELKNNKEKYTLSPVSMYIDGLPGFAVQCKIDGNTVWTQPILIIQNRYPSAMINEWNGKELEIGDNHILASMIGAGKKEDDNSFSGVLLGDLNGKIASDTTPSEYTGIFGFNKGVMSYSFTDDGKATLGKATGAQILFDGNNSTISSAGYKNGYGMFLDLDDSIIESKNNSKTIFKLDKNTPYLQINALDTNGTKTLINIGDNSYYLKSKNYSTTSYNTTGNPEGMFIDLENGKIYAKEGTFHGQININPSSTTYTSYTHSQGKINSDSSAKLGTATTSLNNILASIASNASYAEALAQKANYIASIANEATEEASLATKTLSSFIDAITFSTSGGYYDNYNNWVPTSVTGIGVSSSYYLGFNRSGIKLVNGDYQISNEGGGWSVKGNLLVSGTIYGTLDSSDERLKTNINHNLNNYKNLFFNLKPTDFNYKQNLNKINIGFIAQEIENIPDSDKLNLVSIIKTKELEDQRVLNYNNFIGLNTYMLQEAYKEIDILKQEIKELKEQIQNG